jgi:hypothetical protein
MYTDLATRRIYPVFTKDRLFEQWLTEMLTSLYIMTALLNGIGEVLID